MSNLALGADAYIVDLTSYEVVGFAVYAFFFGLSVAVSFPCIFYLMKNWKRTTSHMVVSTFSLAISLMNIFAFVLRTFTVVCHIQQLKSGDPLSFGFFVFDFPFHGQDYLLPPGFLSAFFPTVFIWISDAFLLYRLCMIWNSVWNRRKLLLCFPLAAYAASLIMGIILMNKTVNSLEEIGDDTLLDTTLMWVPQMGFSFGLDIICTSMIAGFLITHHRLIKRYNIRNTTTYLSFLVIIVESAALSSLAKGIQLLLGCLIGSKGSRLAITLNIFFIPLVTISSNLIMLRKALGINTVSSTPAQNWNVPAVRVRSLIGRVGVDQPRGMEDFLTRTLGGHAEDDYSERQSEESNEIKRVVELPKQEAEV